MRVLKYMAIDGFKCMASASSFYKKKRTNIKYIIYVTLAMTTIKCQLNHSPNTIYATTTIAENHSFNMLIHTFSMRICVYLRNA